MNTFVDRRLFVFAIAAMTMLAPGVPAVIRSPYGLQPVELWLAVVYLLSGTVLSLSVCSRVLQAILTRFSSSYRLLGMGFVVLVPVVWLAAVAVPFALLMVFHAVASPTGFTSHWLLTNRYIEHFATESVRSHMWLVAPVAVAAWVWLRPSRAGSLHSKNAP